MSLPPLLKYIYNYGLEEVIRRGKKIFHNAGVQLLDSDPLIEQIRFRVRNDLYHNYYTVTISRYLQQKDISVRCQCPYNLGDICRHEVAALFQLNDFLQSGFLDQTEVSYDQQHTTLRMRQINRQTLQMFSSANVMEQAEEWAYHHKVNITKEAGNQLKAVVTPAEKQTFQVSLQQNEERFFDTSCTCNETQYPLCAHKAAVFLHVFRTKGMHYFRTMHNWDEQKNKLLKLYGYSLTDDLTGKFSFTYDNGKPFLRVLDPAIKRVELPLPEKIIMTQAVAEQPEPKLPVSDRRLGIVFDLNATSYPFLSLYPISGMPDENMEHFTGKIEKLASLRYSDLMRFPEQDRVLPSMIQKFATEELIKFIFKAYPFSNTAGLMAALQDVPEQHIQDIVWEYLLPKYRQLSEQVHRHPFCFLLQKGEALSAEKLEPVALSDKKLYPQLLVSKEGYPDGGKHYQVMLEWRLDRASVPYEEVTLLNQGLLLYDHHIYTIDSHTSLSIAGDFQPEGVIHIPEADWPAFLEQQVMNWSQQIQVHFSDELTEKTGNLRPRYQVTLRERENILVFKPAFIYGSVSVPWGTRGDMIQPVNGKIQLIRRNIQEEDRFLHHLRLLHSDMQQHPKEHFFYLSAHAVLTHNWFFRFMEEMKEWDVEVSGLETLKQLRVNTHQPVTRLHVEQGIDWFDASVELAFGDQTVNIADVKKALAAKQNYVRLQDGTLGMLPEEWMKKYTLLIKVGETKAGKLRLKKYHFSVLDELFAEMDENAQQEELEAKKERLTAIIIQDYSELKPPPQLKATLRPYQLAGFRWLAFLNASGWGGILADDMGLGKTVQALAYLQHHKNEYPEARFLVVCPTTLMYNWENEIAKFTPELTHHIHHGPKRTLKVQDFDLYDIIITTYGTMRSDIRMLHSYHFDYCILDESQAIKNPQSQVAKASLLLSATHRLALSGTPVQNNTFDLYAQMHFLNPGILGSREFFMNEFAIPIDKLQEQDVKKQLRQLTYPFMLRRTKEQVAKDLPEKTETILYCEMGREQRMIYDAYRNSYKAKILDMIEEQGIDRSRLHILQGLTRLRQICDSPAILKDGITYENHSVKLDEIAREITENISDHKALIFSQFLGMLALIKEKLKTLKIPYVYFDGSTSASDREKAIQRFQQDDSCRIFLISLKAGGIGLNLTAADYVYIVDPWWNPAVEQQAIDRTHRIGQTRNIFAYRLICRNTIEEKMLLLQERKRLLAHELVSDDGAMLKRLTREDIDYLLS